MKRIGEFKYKKVGIIAHYVEIPLNPTNGEVDQKYVVEIEGDPGMTQKILDSLVKIRVTKEEIRENAKTVFEIIEEGIFKPIIKGEERSKLFIEFEEKFRIIPVFKVITIAEEGRSQKYRAILSNIEVPQHGESRSVQSAKAEALQKYFKYLQEQETLVTEKTE